MSISWNVSSASARFAFFTALFVGLSVLASTTPAQTPQGHEVTKVVGHLPLENIHVNQLGPQYTTELLRPISPCSTSPWLINRMAEPGQRFAE
jgi:hypothetical protein